MLFVSNSVLLEHLWRNVVEHYKTPVLLPAKGSQTLVRLARTFLHSGSEELIRSAWDILFFLLTFALKGHENRPYIITVEPQGWLARAFPKGAINQALQLHFLFSFWFSFYAAVTQLLCKTKRFTVPGLAEICLWFAELPQLSLKTISKQHLALFSWYFCTHNSTCK